MYKLVILCSLFLIVPEMNIKVLRIKSFIIEVNKIYLLVMEFEELGMIRKSFYLIYNFSPNYKFIQFQIKV